MSTIAATRTMSTMTIMTTIMGRITIIIAATTMSTSTAAGIHMWLRGTVIMALSEVIMAMNTTAMVMMGRRSWDRLIHMTMIMGPRLCRFLMRKTPATPLNIKSIMIIKPPAAIMAIMVAARKRYNLTKVFPAINLRPREA